jgi:hypothetical protein
LIAIKHDHLTIMNGSSIRTGLTGEHREYLVDIIDRPAQPGNQNQSSPALVKRHLSFGERFPVNS